MSMPNNLIGKRLGNYQIDSLLGTGGMATVYRARQLNIERDVAIKVLRPDSRDVETMVKRFAREAQTVATLRHPNILKLFDYGQHEGLVYLVMELMPGGSLAELVQREQLPLNRIGRLLQQIASALDYAHEHGIIHRDLKSHNVLLDEMGNANLTDFGIAKMIETDHSNLMTQTGMAMGTPAYMAPEQWTGKDVDTRTDIYALGVMTFELFSGQLPFRGETIYAMMHMHVYETPPSIRDLRNDLPPEIEMVFQRALAKNPDDRFQSAALLFEAFRAAITRRGGTGRLGGSVLQTVVNRIAPQTQYSPRELTTPKEQSLRKGTSPGQRRTDLKSIDQIWVPAGCFTMGSDPKKDKNAQPNEQPAHQVCLTKGYWLDMYPVTQSAFQRFIDDGGYNKRDFWTEDGWAWRQSQGDNCPINYENFVNPHHPRVGISWFEADAYARWRGGRLPTEAEWEYAARGPNSPIYPWGDTFDSNNAVVKTETTFQVGLKETGKSWCNAYDMAANVYEWVADWYEFRYYHTSPPDDPPGPPTGKLHVVRGGPESFLSARCAFRHFDYPGYRGRFFGFRVLSPTE